MKKVLVILAAAMLFVTVGCAGMGPIGILYTGVKAPGAFDTGMTTNPGGSEITGESCSMGILGLIAIGDWSIDAALKAAGAEGKTLKNVAVDHRTMAILGALYGNYCTRVTAQVAQ